MCLITASYEKVLFSGFVLLTSSGLKIYNPLTERGRRRCKRLTNSSLDFLGSRMWILGFEAEVLGLKDKVLTGFLLRRFFDNCR
jgi:hypothetical protein